MADHQRLVGEIRSFLQSSDWASAEGLHEPAAAYVEACREVNQRLGRCEELLNKGLRSEAIHLAQAEPVLLDLVAVLDFPERPQWEEVSGAYGLPAPPKLRLDAAEALNKAYAEELPLEHLLRRHRRLALARAPLNNRLQTMRSIAELDGQNPVWAEDIAALEKARHRQLEQDLHEAVARQAVPVLTALAEEVRRTRWLVPPPSALVTLVEKTTRKWIQQAARQELQKLEADLNEAFGAFDVNKGRKLRDRFNQLTTEVSLTKSDPLMERMAPALDWLTVQDKRQLEERRYESTVAALEQALDRGTGQEELKRLAFPLQKHERGMPEALAQRYQERLHDLAAAAARRRRLLLIGIAATVVLLSGLLTVLAIQAHRAGRVRETAQELTRRIQEGEVKEDLSDARTYLNSVESQDPWIAASTEIHPLREQLVALETEQDRRDEKVEQFLAQAREAPLEQQEPAALAEAKKLSRTKDQKNRVRQLTEDRTRKLDEKALGQNKVFETQLMDLRKEVQGLEDQLPRDPFDSGAAGRAVQEWQDRLNGMKARSGGVSEDLRELRDGLEKRVDGVRQAVKDRDKEKQFENQLTGALRPGKDPDKDLAGYLAALESYRQEMPRGKRQADFERALAEQKAWQALLAWESLMRLSRDNPLGLQPPAARELAAKLKEFNQNYPRFHEAATAHDYQRYLEAVGSRDNPEDGASAALHKVFDDFMIRDIWYVKTTDRKTFYFEPTKAMRQVGPENLKKSMELVTIKYFKTYSNASGEVKGLRAYEIEAIGPAPQAQVVDEAAKLTNNFAEDKLWGPALEHIVRMILANEEIDPVLRSIMLRKVLQAASKGSYPLALALAKQVEYIQKETAGLKLSVFWMDPQNDEARGVRIKANDILVKLPPLRGAGETARQKEEELKAALARAPFTLAGWLDRDSAGWHCRSAFPVAGDSELAVVVPGDDGADVWKTVGKLHKGQPHLDAESKGLLQGRLVFARPSQ